MRFKRSGRLYMPESNGVGLMGAAFGAACLVSPIANNPIIAHQDPPFWLGAQVQQPFVKTDPNDASRQILSFVGMQLSGGFAIGGTPARTTALTASPTIWNQNFVTLINGESKFLDSVLSPDETPDGLWWYYVSTNGGPTIELRKSADGFAPLTPDPGTVVLDTTNGPAGCTSVTSLSVCRVLPNYWVGVFNYRSGTETLPGLLWCDSPDGVVWTTRNGANKIISTVPNTTYSTFYESQQLLFMGGKFLAICSNYSAINLTQGWWTTNVFSATDMNGPWTPSAKNPVVSLRSRGLQNANFNQFNIGGKWYGFAQVCPGPDNYGTQRWDLWQFNVNGTPLDMI